MGLLLFMSSFTGMAYYGNKTFNMEKKGVTKQEYAYHFALIAEEADNEYWRMIEQGARKFADEHHIYLEYVAPQKADDDQLLKLLDRMLSMKVDGIITQGIEGKRFVNLALKGLDRRIPMITIDTDVKSSARKAYVGTDNFHAGQLAAQTIINHTTGEQYVGIVTGRLVAVNQQERIAGFKEAVESEERIHIVDIKESNITQIGAAQATYSLLKEYPEINVLIGMSALDGIGIVEGLQEIAPHKNVYITAFDILPETLSLMDKGKIDTVISQYPKEMGYKAMEVMMELQNGDLLDNQIFTDTKIIEKGSNDTYNRGNFK